MRKIRKALICIAFAACFSFVALNVAHATSYTATVNFVGTTSAGTPWINITSGSSTVNYLIPTAQGNAFLAIAMTAISSGKQVIIDVSGGSWSTLNSISLKSS